jgi:hypothetical protein
MGNNKKEKFTTKKTGGGCNCGSKSSGYSCGKHCKNKKGGRFTCGSGAGDICGPATHAASNPGVSDTDFMTTAKPTSLATTTGAGRRSKRRSNKQKKNPRNKTKKKRRKIRTKKGGVWPFNNLFGSNNNTQSSQNQYPENNVDLPPMSFNEPQPNITRPPTPSAVRSYGSYGPTARRNNRRRQAQAPPRRQQLTQAQQFQLNRMNNGANQFSGPVGKNIIKAGNTEAEVRKRINVVLGTLDIYMGRIFERQLQVNCNEKGHTLYMNTLYVFTHHIIQILLTPKVTELAQMLIGSSSNFIGNLLVMIHQFFTEQVASIGEINESFLAMVSWFIRTMGSGIKLALDLSEGPVLFSNFVIAIMKFLQETTVNMTTTTIIPLGVFIYLVFNTFVYSYMKVLDRTDKIIKFIEPILQRLGIVINNVEKMTADELKDTIRNNIWDYIVTNSPVDVVLRRDVLDGHIARICQSAINHDYVLWMLQTAFGEHVSRESQTPMTTQHTVTPLSPLIPTQNSSRRSPMAFGQAPPMAFGQAPPMAFGQAPPMAPSMSQPTMLPQVQQTPYPTHHMNSDHNSDPRSYDYDNNYDYLNSRTVRQLQAILKKNKLEQNGKKEVLIERLLDSGWSL